MKLIGSDSQSLSQSKSKRGRPRGPPSERTLKEQLQLAEDEIKELTAAKALRDAEISKSRKELDELNAKVEKLLEIGTSVKSDRGSPKLHRSCSSDFKFSLGVSTRMFSNYSPIDLHSFSSNTSRTSSMSSSILSCSVSIHPELFSLDLDSFVPVCIIHFSYNHLLVPSSFCRSRRP
jgi:hypothetical protein